MLGCAKRLLRPRCTSEPCRPAAPRRPKSTDRQGAHGAYCSELVRRHDHENFLSSLLLPADGRRAALAVRAFNVELAQIQDVVSRPEIGLMRLQFWTDTVEQIYEGSAPEQPIAQELAAVVHSQRLSKHWFTRLVESRRPSAQAHGSLEEAEEYAERSVSPVFYLILQAMGVQDLGCDHVASHVGKLQGLTNLIRGVPANASRGRVYLPLQLLAKHKVSQESLARGKADAREVVYELARAAHQHLEK
ncbi:unnamed protein product, partial [Ixodes hexagonus]